MPTLFKKTKQQKDEDFEKQEFSFPGNVSMKNEGDSIEGVYQGLMVKPGEGLNGGDLIIAGFEVNGKLITCVAGSQIQTFLKSFKQGYWLKIIRNKTLKLKDDRPFATYDFEYNPLGLKEENEIKFLDATELPETKQLKE